MKGFLRTEIVKSMRGVLRGFEWQIAKFGNISHLVGINDLSQHYRGLLGLDDSWTVSDVALDLDESHVCHRANASWWPPGLSSVSCKLSCKLFACRYR